MRLSEYGEATRQEPIAITSGGTKRSRSRGWRERRLARGTRAAEQRTRTQQRSSNGKPRSCSVASGVGLGGFTSHMDHSLSISPLSHSWASQWFME